VQHQPHHCYLSYLQDYLEWHCTKLRVWFDEREKLANHQWQKAFVIMTSSLLCWKWQQNDITSMQRTTSEISRNNDKEAYNLLIIHPNGKLSGDIW
jgi:hypothetical protein